MLSCIPQPVTNTQFDSIVNLLDNSVIIIENIYQTSLGNSCFQLVLYSNLPFSLFTGDILSYLKWKKMCCNN